MHCLVLLFIACMCLFPHLPAHASPEPKKYTLCICAIFNNEARYLKEWIEYHLLVGVQYFFLYNNQSTDEYLDVLQPYLDRHVIELRDWPNNHKDRHWVDAQRRAFKQCLNYSQELTEWLALIDVDEFIVPVDKPDLLSYLSQFDDQPTLGGIQANWQLYGTSWLPEIPKNKLLIESLVLKAPQDYDGRAPHPYNGRVKSIVRPHAVDTFDIHTAYYKPGFTVLPENKGWERNNQPVQIDHIRINHYWTRAEDFFYNVKLDRLLALGFFKEGDTEAVLNKLKLFNREKDPIMMRFVPELRKRIFPDDP
jgi:hypothetical protein